MINSSPSILMILSWFGKWPKWNRFFLESCRANPTIDWLIITDCGDVADCPPNVTLFHTSLPAYRDLISERLAIQCQWNDAYKICDFKPVMAALHPDRVIGYDYWGFGDIDVVYGDIRSIYTPDVLDHDVISAHADRCSGHLALVRNTQAMNNAFRRVRGWRSFLARKAHVSFDERHWSNLFVTHRGIGLKERIGNWLRSPRLHRRGLFVERFSTNIPPLPWIDGTRDYPEAWIWRDGVLTADNAGPRTFLYAHFSHWQSSRWLKNGQAAWKDRATIDFCAPGRLREFKITADGFLPLAAVADRADVA